MTFKVFSALRGCLPKIGLEYGFPNPILVPLVLSLSGTFPSHFFNRVLSLAIINIAKLRCRMGLSDLKTYSHRHPLPSIETTDSTTNLWLLLAVLPPEVPRIILDLAHETMTLSNWRIISKQFND